MNERRAVTLLLTGLGLAFVAGLGLFFGLAPPLLLKGLILVGVVLAFGAQFRMFRLPEQREEE